MAGYRIGLSPIGVGKLIAWGLVAVLYAGYKVGVAVGLVEPSSHGSVYASTEHPSPEQRQTLAERDAEVKAMIAAREAQAAAIRAEEGAR